MKKQVITITFGDVAENHEGMQKIGQRQQKGFSLENLNHAFHYFKQRGAHPEIIDLHHLVSEEKLPKGLSCDPAYILVVRNGINFILEEGETIAKLHQELKNFEWDSKYFDTRRQKVLNKLARRNVCFGQQAQQPDYENKKGTIVPWVNVPLLNKIKEQLNSIMGTAVQFHAEGNLYHDGGVKHTGLGYHGDAQRIMVAALRTGTNSMPLHYQWFYNSKPIGKNFSVDISPGDFYVMSQKTVGTDWKRRSILTLRHASGASKYVKI